MKINIAIIGCGLIGEKRLKNLNKNFNLIACSDKNIKNISFLKKNKKIKKLKNWKKIFQLENLNAVIIATYHSSLSKIKKKN